MNTTKTLGKSPLLEEVLPTSFFAFAILLASLFIDPELARKPLSKGLV
jgi:hypothetical protein